MSSCTSIRLVDQLPTQMGQFTWVVVQPIQYVSTGFIAIPSKASATAPCFAGSEKTLEPTRREAAKGIRVSDQKEACVVSGVVGRVWMLAQDAKGSRELQHMLDEANTDAVRNELADELKGHVWAAARHPHANYFLQKCIATLRVSALQFILDELAPKNRVYNAARHKYGCRVLQRLFEHCTTDQLQPFVEVVLENFIAFSRHAFANYVIRHFLEFATPKDQGTAVAAIASCPRAFGTDPSAVSVVSAALAHCIEEDQFLIAQALVAETGVLSCMARTRKGSPAVKVVLNLLEGSEHDEACNQLLSNPLALRSRYGRSVIQELGEEFKKRLAEALESLDSNVGFGNNGDGEASCVQVLP